MSHPAVALFDNIAPPAELLADAANRAPGCPRVNNTHIHLPPNFSAFDTVAQAVDLAADQGVQVLGVSNYYHYGVYSDFADRARSSHIFPLFGTEIIALLDDLVAAGVKMNDPGNPGKLYICGKGAILFDPLGDEAARLLDVIREKDSTRMAALVERMGQVFAEAGFDAGLANEDVIARVVARHHCPTETVYLQERHVTQAFQEVMAERLGAAEQVAVLTRAYGAAPKCSPDQAVPTQNEMRSMLMKAGKPAYVTETFVDYNHARSLILALGGIPCYPTLADGTTPRCGFEDTPAGLVERIQGMGLHCAEFIPDRNSPEVLAEYATTMRRAGIVLTAGTEHNTRDLIPIPPACKGGAAIPEAVAAIFWEGACVVAAHQYLVAHGECGYVTSDGSPNPAYSDAESRIAAFRAIGETVIDEYLAN